MVSVGMSKRFMAYFLIGGMAGILCGYLFVGGRGIWQNFGMRIGAGVIFFWNGFIEVLQNS